jgi:hypothetical protein
MCNRVASSPVAHASPAIRSSNNLSNPSRRPALVSHRPMVSNREASNPAASPVLRRSKTVVDKTAAVRPVAVRSQTHNRNNPAGSLADSPVAKTAGVAVATPAIVST